MGIETVLKSLVSTAGPPDGDKPGSLGVALPKEVANPEDVVQFNRQMQADSPAVESVQIPPAQALPPMDARQPQTAEQPGTIGQRLEAAQTHKALEPEQSDVSNWLDSATDIFQKDAISHADLFRVQVLAGMAQIEIHRNAAINQSLDNGMKSLIKEN